MLEETAASSDFSWLAVRHNNRNVSSEIMRTLYHVVKTLEG